MQPGSGVEPLPSGGEPVADFPDTPILGGLGEGARRVLLGGARRRAVAPGGFLVREGEEAASMFLLLRGRVEVRTEEGGVRLRLGTLGPGDCFGEMGILDLQPRSASVVALEPSEALELSSMAIHGLYEHDLEQFALLWMNLARELSRRLRQADLDRARAAGDSP